MYCVALRPSPIQCFELSSQSSCRHCAAAQPTHLLTLPLQQSVLPSSVYYLFKMQLCRILSPPLHAPYLLRSRPFHCSPPSPNFFFKPQSAAPSLPLETRTFPGIRCVSGHNHGVVELDEREVETDAGTNSDYGSFEEEEKRAVVAAEVGEELVEQGLWKQMTEIVKFAGPAAGLWICGPLMSLIDTAVVGQGSSTELAALGTVAFQSIPL